MVGLQLIWGLGGIISTVVLVGIIMRILWNGWS
jgi:hypothetical protein